MEEHPELEPFNLAADAIVLTHVHATASIDAVLERPLKRVSSEELYRRDKQEADASGLRLRMWRPVLNVEDFEEELKVWYPYEKQGAKRFGPSRLGMTVLDSCQQVVPGLAELDEDRVRWRLERGHPGAAKNLGPVAVLGCQSLGGSANCFVALKFDPLRGRVFDDRNTALAAVVPAVRMSDYQQKLHTPHVSLGKPRDMRQAQQIEPQLVSKVPKKVHFGPIRFTIGPDNRQRA